MKGERSRKVNILGVDVDVLTVRDLLERVHAWTGECGNRTVTYANVHVLNNAFEDPELRRTLNGADIVYCDGAGVKLGAAILGADMPERMTGADWIYPLCESCAERGTKLFFLGSKDGVAEQARRILEARFPDLQVAGTHHGYLAAPGVSEAAIAAVRAAGPAILLVGMGTPVQEKWLASHRHELDVPVVWAVGALFDFVAGVHSRAPAWMLKNGLEWMYRLGLEPRRLWRRYLVGNPSFLARLTRQRLGLLRL